MITPSDTTPACLDKQTELLSQMTPQQRVGLTLRLSQTAMNMSRRAIRRVHPEFTELEVGQMFIELHYGKTLADSVRTYQASRATA